MSELQDLAAYLLVPSLFTLVLELSCEVFEVDWLAESLLDVSKSQSVDICWKAFIDLICFDTTDTVTPHVKVLMLLL